MRRRLCSNCDHRYIVFISMDVVISGMFALAPGARNPCSLPCYHSNLTTWNLSVPICYIRIHTHIRIYTARARTVAQQPPPQPLRCSNMRSARARGYRALRFRDGTALSIGEGREGEYSESGRAEGESIKLPRRREIGKVMSDERSVYRSRVRALQGGGRWCVIHCQQYPGKRSTVCVYTVGLSLCVYIYIYTRVCICIWMRKRRGCLVSLAFAWLWFMRAARKCSGGEKRALEGRGK